MKHLLKYRDKFYFNDTDYFLAMNNLGQFYLTDLEKSDGKWYPKHYRAFKGGKLYDSGHWRPINMFNNKGCLQINMLTLPCVNANDLVGLKVRYKDTELTGKISQFILHNMGIDWSENQGIRFKKYGLPYYWNEPHKLELT